MSRSRRRREEWPHISRFEEEGRNGDRPRRQERDPSAPESAEAIVQFPQEPQRRLLPVAFSGEPFFFFSFLFFKEAEPEEEEEPVRGGSVPPQLGHRVSHGQVSLDRRLLPDHQDQSLQGGLSEFSWGVDFLNMLPWLMIDSSLLGRALWFRVLRV